MFLDVRPKLQTKPWGDMGLEFLQGRRDKQLSWWYKVVNMPLSRYPKPFKKSGILNPSCRQRKVWKRVDYIFESLELDKGEWVESSE